MSFLQPLGLLLALALPLIVLFHFRKKQAAEKQVSSLAPWDEVIRELQGVKTRKINRYLLLLLQLLIGALIVAAFARPVWVKPFHGGELTVALDCSLSMQAAEQGGTRFQRAKEELTGYMETVPEDVRVNLALLQKKSCLVLQNARKKELMDKLKDIDCTSEALDLEMAAQILAACPGTRVAVTDKTLPLGDRQLKVGGELDNLGLTCGSYDYYSRTALCRVKNYGSSSAAAVLRLEDGQGRRDIQQAEVPAGTEADVVWPQVWPDAQVLQVSILNGDMLDADDRFLLPVGDEFKKRVLMVGENYFVQKALSSIPGVSVESAKDWDGAEGKYGLYVVCRETPAGTPPDGANVWQLCPPPEMLGEEVEKLTELKVRPGPFARNLDLRGVSTDRCPSLKLPEGYETVLEAGDKPVMACGSEGGTRRLYSAADWNKTNLPLLPGFPILVDNIVNWFFQDDPLWHEPGDLVYPVQGKAFKLVGPAGFAETLDRVPVTLEKPGIYNITEGSRNVRKLIVNPPPGLTAGNPPGAERPGDTVNDGRSAYPGVFSPSGLQNIILAIVLVLLAAEWQVFKREL